MEDMDNFKTIDSSALSLIILIFIYYNARNKLEKIFISHRIFLGLVLTNILLIFSDVGAWVFDGLPGVQFLLLNKVFNLMLFVIEPVAGTLWVLYVSCQIKQNEMQLRFFKYMLLMVLCRLPVYTLVGFSMWIVTIYTPEGICI